MAKRLIRVADGAETIDKMEQKVLEALRKAKQMAKEAWEGTSSDEGGSRTRTQNEDLANQFMKGFKEELGWH